MGHTNSIKHRLAQHNDPASRGWTVSYQPWRLVYYEEFNTRAEAMKFEKYLKSLKNKQALLKYVKQNSEDRL